MPARHRPTQGRMPALFLLLAAAICAGACVAGQSSAVRLPENDSPLSKAPPAATELRNPYDDQSEAVAAGAKIFRKRCLECHGRDAMGTKRAPALRSESVEKASPGRIFWLLTNGERSKGMPSWASLPEAQRWQFVAYLKNLR